MKLEWTVLQHRSAAYGGVVIYNYAYHMLMYRLKLRVQEVTNNISDLKRGIIL